MVTKTEQYPRTQTNAHTHAHDTIIARSNQSITHSIYHIMIVVGIGHELDPVCNCPTKEEPIHCSLAAQKKKILNQFDAT